MKLWQVSASPCWTLMEKCTMTETWVKGTADGRRVLYGATWGRVSTLTQLSDRGLFHQWCGVVVDGCPAASTLLQAGGSPATWPSHVLILLSWCMRHGKVYWVAHKGLSTSWKGWKARQSAPCCATWSDNSTDTKMCMPGIWARQGAKVHILTHLHGVHTRDSSQWTGAILIKMAKTTLALY